MGIGRTCFDSGSGCLTKTPLGIYHALGLGWAGLFCVLGPCVLRNTTAPCNSPVVPEIPAVPAGPASARYRLPWLRLIDWTGLKAGLHGPVWKYEPLARRAYRGFFGPLGRPLKRRQCSCEGMSNKPERYRWASSVSPGLSSVAGLLCCSGLGPDPCSYPL